MSPSSRLIRTSFAWSRGSGFRGWGFRGSRPFGSYRTAAGWIKRVAASLALYAVLPLAASLAPQAAERPIRLVVLGDSLTAGYGLATGDAFPAKLSQALAARGRSVEVINAGVSGDTATGGLARVDWSVPEGTDAVIVELGANDALRGIDPKVTQAALDGIIRRLRERGMAVLLAGMNAPRNFGSDYAAAFDAIYPALAAKHGVALYPFFLDGVATNVRLNQADGLHPTAAGIDEIVTRILPAVEMLLASARTRSRT